MAECERNSKAGIVPRRGEYRERRNRDLLLAYDATKEGLDYLLQASEIERLPGGALHPLAVTPKPTGLFLGEGDVLGDVLDEERVRADATLDAGIAQIARRGSRHAAVSQSGNPSKKSAERRRNCAPA